MAPKTKTETATPTEAAPTAEPVDKYTPAYIEARYSGVKTWIETENAKDPEDQHAGLTRVTMAFEDLNDQATEDKTRRKTSEYLGTLLSRYKLEALEVKRVHSSDPNKMNYEQQVRDEAASCFSAEAANIVGQAKPLRSSSKEDAPTTSNLNAEIEHLAGRLAFNNKFDKNTNYAETHYRTGEPLATEEDEPTEEPTQE